MTVGSFFWTSPPNFPLGIYHLHVNMTAIAINNTFDEITLTRSKTYGPILATDVARSQTFKFVAPDKPEICTEGPRVPAPYPTTTSPFSDPNWSSFVLTRPHIGEDLTYTAANNTNGTLVLNWEWRNLGNRNNAFISELKVQLQNAKDDSNVGQPFEIIGQPTKADPSTDDVFLSLNLTGRAVVPGNSYSVLVTYKNELPDGVKAPGELVMYKSPVFNVINPTDTCATVGNFNSGNPSGSGSGSGQGRNNAAMNRVGSMVAGALLIVLGLCAV